MGSLKAHIRLWLYTVVMLVTITSAYAQRIKKPVAKKTAVSSEAFKNIYHTRISQRDYINKLKGAYIGKFYAEQMFKLSQDAQHPKDSSGLPVWHDTLINRMFIGSEMSIQLRTLEQLISKHTKKSHAGILRFNTDYEALSLPSISSAVEYQDAESQANYIFGSTMIGMASPLMQSQSLAISSEYSHITGNQETIYATAFLNQVLSVSFKRQFDFADNLSESAIILPETNPLAMLMKEMLSLKLQEPNNSTKAFDAVKKLSISRSICGADKQIHPYQSLGFAFATILYSSSSIEDVLFLLKKNNALTAQTAGLCGLLLGQKIGFINLPEKYKYEINYATKFKGSEFTVDSITKRFLSAVAKTHESSGGFIEFVGLGKVYHIPTIILPKPLPELSKPTSAKTVKLNIEQNGYRVNISLVPSTEWVNSFWLMGDMRSETGKTIEHLYYKQDTFQVTALIINTKGEYFKQSFELVSAMDIKKMQTLELSSLFNKAEINSANLAELSNLKDPLLHFSLNGLPTAPISSLTKLDFLLPGDNFVKLTREQNKLKSGETIVKVKHQPSKDFKFNIPLENSALLAVSVKQEADYYLLTLNIGELDMSNYSLNFQSASDIASVSFKDGDIQSSNSGALVSLQRELKEASIKLSGSFASGLDLVLNHKGVSVQVFPLSKNFIKSVCLKTEPAIVR